MTLTHSTDSLARRETGATQRRVITDVVTILQGASGTDDKMTLLDIRTPASGGIPAHAQRYEDELLFVLEGVYTVLCGEEQVEMRAGDSLFIARGTRHGYVNAGTGAARMLAFVAPGGIHEQFLDEVGDHVHRPTWEPDMAKVLAVAPKYGITFLSADER